MSQYFQCSCGTYLTRDGRKPVDPGGHCEVLTIGIGGCDACKGTPYDLHSNFVDGETAGETRRRIGYHPDSRRARGLE